MNCNLSKLRLNSNRILLLIFVLTNLILLVNNQNAFANNSDFQFEANLVYNDLEQRFDGYNLFVVEKRDSSTWHVVSRSLLITDMTGNIYFQKNLQTTSVFVDFPAKFIDSHTIMYGEDDGIRLWDIETNEVIKLSIEGHHDYEKNYLRNSYYSVFGYSDVVDNVTYIYDYISESKANGDFIWTFTTKELLIPEQWCPYEDMIGASRDLSHVNTLCYDEDEDCLYVNVRNVNTFYKIDAQSKEVYWGLGEYGNFTLYDIHGKEKNSLFYHAHALEKIRDNTFLIFDNDFHNKTDANDRQSRLLEIVLDEDKMQANITWEWIAPEEYYSDIWGDCDILPNENYLGVFGTHLHPGTKFGARLVEVNTQGDIIWEMSFPEKQGYTYGVYMADRFHFTPIVSDPVFIDEGEGSGYLEWDVWYNFRAKTDFVGKYYINLDGTDIETGQFTYKKYWQQEKFQYYTDLETIQNHDISLIAEDEAGHKSNESEIYSPINSIQIEIGDLSGFDLIIIPTLSAVVGYYIKKRKRVNQI